MNRSVHLTGVERGFAVDDIIVSKTDLKGRIVYANNVFLDLFGGPEAEAIGAPHSLIRHPDMPRVVFKKLWDTVQAGDEIFAYVVNRSKNGDHYWVLAHVTPNVDMSGNVVGYHSNRRVPNKRIVDEIIRPLYRDLAALENKADRKEGLMASEATFDRMMKERGVAYDRFIFSLGT